MKNWCAYFLHWTQAVVNVMWALSFSLIFFQSQFSCVGPSSHTHTLEWKNCGNSQGKPCRGNLFNKKKIWKFQRAFPPRTRSHCVSAHRSNKDFFKGSLEWHQRKMRGRLHEFRNSLLVSIQQQHKSRFSAAGGAPHSICALILYQHAVWSVFCEPHFLCVQCH